MIIILKSHSGHPLAQREGSVYQRMHTNTRRAKVSVGEKTERVGTQTQRKSASGGQSAVVLLPNDESENPLCTNSEDG